MAMNVSVDDLEDPRDDVSALSYVAPRSRNSVNSGFAIRREERAPPAARAYAAASTAAPEPHHTHTHTSPVASTATAPALSASRTSDAEITSNASAAWSRTGAASAPSGVAHMGSHTAAVTHTHTHTNAHPPSTSVSIPSSATVYAYAPSLPSPSLPTGIEPFDLPAAGDEPEIASSLVSTGRFSRPAMTAVKAAARRCADLQAIFVSRMVRDLGLSQPDARKLMLQLLRGEGPKSDPDDTRGALTRHFTEEYMRAKAQFDVKYVEFRAEDAFADVKDRGVDLLSVFMMNGHIATRLPRWPVSDTLNLHAALRERSREDIQRELREVLMTMASLYGPGVTDVLRCDVGAADWIPGEEFRFKALRSGAQVVVPDADVLYDTASRTLILSQSTVGPSVAAAVSVPKMERYTWASDIPHPYALAWARGGSSHRPWTDMDARRMWAYFPGGVAYAESTRAGASSFTVKRQAGLELPTPDSVPA